MFSLFFKWNPVSSFMFLSEFTSCPRSPMVLGGEGWRRFLSKLWPTWHLATGWSRNWESLEITGFSVVHFGSCHHQCCSSVFPCHTEEIHIYNFLILCRGQVWATRVYRPLFSDLFLISLNGEEYYPTPEWTTAIFHICTEYIMLLVWIYVT